jgi:formylglycine-generating enzyme required for sulfatase activity
METAPISTQALPPGTRIEEFVIERVLGSGGFGITYLARDARLGRQVVIKENLPVQFCFRDTHSLTVAPRHTHGEDAENFRWSLENFSKEAAMLASLDHPGIVRVHRSFEALGTAYFVMPFVDGVAFDHLIEQHQADQKLFGEDGLRGLLTRMLGALGYLHDRGIYHRDIKPGNILVTNEGVPVLIDFGSARQRLSERSMTVIESAGYTPFEQLQSRGQVGPWSDLYALGGTLVKAITFESLPKAADRVFDDPFVPLADRAELLTFYGDCLLTSVDKALAVLPQNRHRDARDWLAVLQAPTPSGTESIAGQIRDVRSSGQEVVAQEAQARAAHEAANRRRQEALAREAQEQAERKERIRSQQEAIVRETQARAAREAEYRRRQEAIVREAQEQAEQAEQEETIRKQMLEVLGSARVREAFTLIQSGNFQMGDALDGMKDAPVCIVQVSAFYMGQYEVTKALWDKVRTWALVHGYGKWLTSLPTGKAKAANHPVHSVNWYDVVKWCNARSEMEGLTPCYSAGGKTYRTGMVNAVACNWATNGYRLPTEAEWEKSARGGISGKRFPWGDTISHKDANFCNKGGETYQTGTSGHHPTYGTGSTPHTSPVGSFAPNSYGLHDVAGNVWEWCWDWYDKYPFTSLADPRGAASGSDRAGRGGSWGNSANNSRVALRSNNDPANGYVNVGFRVARSSVP